jgi:hypothetical protein
LLMLAIVATNAVEITTPRPAVECGSQNCIISFTKMDDDKFNEMIPVEKKEILALKFSSCKLETIPKSVFERLPSLLCIMTTTPGVATIEDGTFSGASNLQFLYLPGNRIKKLNSKAFSGASNLNEINLTDNEIEVVAEDAFEGLEHLESLSLSRNQIAFFGQSTFAPMTDLMNLDISGNTIEFLDARLFRNNEKLNGINIADNQIVSITNGFLELLPQIKVLNMMNNPCTNDTMLENIPLIKIIDSKDLNSEDESSLDRCYQNFIDMADPESTDFNDLLSEADIVREDIEADIIADLTDELREKDELIKNLQRSNEIAVIMSLIFIGSLFFLFVIKLIMRVVNNTYQREIQKKINDHVEVVRVDPKQIIYTIEV